MLFVIKKRRHADHSRSLSVRAGRARTVMIYTAIGVLLGSSAVAESDNRSSPKCYEDAMLVFDASGSMSGVDAYTAGIVPATRIDDARAALAQSLPRVTPYRRLGLMTYGPGGHCNVALNMRPAFDAGPKIMAELMGIDPDGLTPLTIAVAQAANVLDYRNKPGIVVLLTDGWETCGGQPCALAETLKSTGKAITVHVIGYRMQDLISQREQGVTDMKCLAATTGGRFIGAGSIDELVAALNKTLGCPLIAKRRAPDVDFARLHSRLPS